MTIIIIIIIIIVAMLLNWAKRTSKKIKQLHINCVAIFKYILSG